MNPSTNNLDPKLKEVYEKVMGTPFADSDNTKVNQEEDKKISSQPILQTQPIPQVPLASVFQNQTTSPTTQTPFSTEAKMQTPIGHNEIFEPIKSSPKNIINLSADSENAQVKKRGLSPIILALGGFSFFVVYAVIWAKVFGLI